MERSRSRDACPACGAHQLALDEDPRIDVMGVQPYSDLLGMGDLRPPGQPAIVCLACGTRWRDLAAFRSDEREPAPADDAGQPSANDAGRPPAD
jgi:hypothetical protein